MSSVGVMASSVLVGTTVLMEPFDNFTDGGWILNGSPLPSIVAGRTGTAASVGGTTGIAAYRFPAAAEYVTIGFAWQATAIGSLRSVAKFYSDTGTVLQYQVRTNGTAFTFDRSITTIATSTGVTVAINTWYYIELQVRIHDTAGTAVMRVNGVEVLNFAGDTRAAGTSMIDTVELRPATSATTNLYDDLYISVGTGAPFKGPITIP